MSKFERVSVGRDEIDRVIAEWLNAPLIEDCWRSSTVLDMASTIIGKQRFDVLPILGDALMDAGCDDNRLIRLCQRNSPLALAGFAKVNA